MVDFRPVGFRNGKGVVRNRVRGADMHARLWNVNLDAKDPSGDMAHP